MLQENFKSAAPSKENAAIAENPNVRVGVKGGSLKVSDKETKNPYILLSDDSKFHLIRLPWDHQLQAFKRAIEHENFGLFLECGTGKSLTAILIARYWMHLAKRPLRTFILTPQIAIENWKEEWLTASTAKPEQILTLNQSGKERARLLKKSNPIIAITNYEGLLNEEFFDAICAFKPEIIIYDESHKCKDYRAKRSKLCFKLSKLKSVQHRYLLTGTPTLNSAADLFQQLKIMDCGETFGGNRNTFLHTYFYDRNLGMPPQVHFADWQIKPGALRAITQKIEKISLSLKKSECLTLPPLLKLKIYVELEGEQKRTYDEVKKDFLSYMDGKACVAQLALTKALRLMQIVSGFISLEDENGKKELRNFKPDPKAQALVQILESLPEKGKVIVWASFKQNYDTIRRTCENLKIKYRELHGDIRAGEKATAVSDFNNDPDIKVCIAHPGAGGIGINLTRAAYSVFYSRTFSLEHEIQAESRNYRGGSDIHEKITRYDIIGKGTIDEIVMKALENKQHISNEILQHLALELKNES